MEGCIFQEAIAKGGKESVVISWSIFFGRSGVVSSRKLSVRLIGVGLAVPICAVLI